MKLQPLIDSSATPAMTSRIKATLQFVSLDEKAMQYPQPNIAVSSFQNFFNRTSVPGNNDKVYRQIVSTVSG